MVLEQLDKRLLVLVPPKAILGMADIEPFKVELAEQSEPCIAAAGRGAEYQRRPISLLSAPFDQSVLSEERKPRARIVSRIAKRSEALDLKPPSEIEIDILSP